MFSSTGVCTTSSGKGTEGARRPDRKGQGRWVMTASQSHQMKRVTPGSAAAFCQSHLNTSMKSKHLRRGVDRRAILRAHDAKTREGVHQCLVIMQCVSLAAEREDASGSLRDLELIGRPTTFGRLIVVTTICVQFNVQGGRTLRRDATRAVAIRGRHQSSCREAVGG